MDNNTIQQLVNIYNNLLQVHTCGEDSFIMTDSMRALFNVIKNNAEKAQYFSTKTLRKVQKKIGFPERIR